MNPREAENRQGGMRRPSATEKLSMLTLVAAAMGANTLGIRDIILGTEFAGRQRRPTDEQHGNCLNCSNRKNTDQPFCSANCCHEWKAKKKAERQVKKDKGQP